MGYKRRSTDERLRVAEALQNLPELGQALREGRVTWSVARELTRVATPENERAWLDVVRGRTVPQIEASWRDTAWRSPRDAYDASLRRHVLR